MENDFTSDILAAAAELAAERDKLTALLSLPEVASDGKLVVHYRKRLRASEPLLRAYASYRESHSEEDLAAIKTEYLLLSLAEHGDAASYAGAGVCAYTRNIKDSGEKDAALAAFKTLVAAVGATVTMREESETYFRAEALGDKVYALLSGTGKSALGNDISFTVYPILALPEIREKDIRTDVFLNGGKGGQNVNKVETAIRMTHLPTGVTVTCRDERSQLQNKKRAAKLLRERVAEYYRAAQNALIEKAKRGDAPTKE